MATQVEAISSRSFSIDRAHSIPWTLWLMALACTSAIIGAHWDISWHSSIGRDAFFTPAHIAIYLCGVFGGLSSGWLIFSNTFLPAHSNRANTVEIFGLRAPLGAFLVAWGGLAMLTSAPFDDWWHNAYGLDVKIISPPHVLLIFGFLMVQTGGLIMTLGERNRATTANRKHLDSLFLYLGGLVLITFTILLLELTSRTLMHTAFFYRSVCLFVPLALAVMSRASDHKWAATITAGIYTVFLLGFQWILPLFPAEPKLGPVFYPTTYFVPPQFPLLLVFPAFAIDLLRRRTRHLGLALESAILGLTFLTVFMAVQWPFANFLMSDAAKNWFFGSHHFGYYVHPKSNLRLGLFTRMANEQSWSGFLAILGQAALASMVFTAAGSSFGNWLRKVQR
jgi:hypothetical protein